MFVKCGGEVLIERIAFDEFICLIYLFVLLRRSIEGLLLIFCKQKLFVMRSPHGVTFPSEVETVFASENDGKVRPEGGAAPYREYPCPPLLCEAGAGIAFISRNGKGRGNAGVSGDGEVETGRL